MRIRPDQVEEPPGTQPRTPPTPKSQTPPTRPYIVSASASRWRPGFRGSSICGCRYPATRFHGCTWLRVFSVMYTFQRGFGPLWVGHSGTPKQQGYNCPLVASEPSCGWRQQGTCSTDPNLKYTMKQTKKLLRCRKV